MLQEEPAVISARSSGIRDVHRKLRNVYCICKNKKYVFLSKYAIYPLVQKKKMIYHRVNQEAEERSYRI